MRRTARPDGHSARATRALQKLAELDPAFASLALWIDHRDASPDDLNRAVFRLDEDPEAPAWTDGQTIYYGPQFEVLADDIQIGVAAHQILHVALRHPARDRVLRARLGPRHRPRLFNIAADALINETLVAAGYSIPRPSITLRAMPASALGQDVPRQEALAKWDAERLTLALLDAEPDGRTQAPGDGEAPHAASTAEDAARAAAFRPDLADDPSGDRQGAETPDADADWRERLARALEEGKLAGRGIGALGFRIADIPVLGIPWERHLRSLALRALTDAPRLDWARPSRRWAGMDAEARSRGTTAPVYEPGQRRDTSVPRVVVGIDCSSSVDAARLKLFLGQVAGIARKVSAELFAIPFDDGVQSVAKIPMWGAEAALRRLDLGRDGGTSFEPLFEKAAALSPSLLIVLTDLDAPVPPAIPGVPLIWAVPAPPKRHPPHGKVLDLSM